MIKKKSKKKEHEASPSASVKRYAERAVKRTTIVKKRRPGVAVSTGTSSRTTIRSRSGGDVNVRGSVRTRETTTGTSSSTSRSSTSGERRSGGGGNEGRGSTTGASGGGQSGQGTGGSTGTGGGAQGNR